MVCKKNLTNLYLIHAKSDSMWNGNENAEQNLLVLPRVIFCVRKIVIDDKLVGFQRAPRHSIVNIMIYIRNN